MRDGQLDEIEALLGRLDAVPSVGHLDGADLGWVRPALHDLLDEIRRLRQAYASLTVAFDAMCGERDQARTDQEATAERLTVEADRLRAAWESAWAERNEARGLLYRFVDHDDEPCWLDHHGYCQAHGLSNGPCRVAEARRILGLGPDDASLGETTPTPRVNPVAAQPDAERA